MTTLLICDNSLFRRYKMHFVAIVAVVFVVVVVERKLITNLSALGL